MCRIPMPKSDTDKDQQKREKQDRLTKALRDNLFRRKQQMRARKQSAPALDAQSSSPKSVPTNATPAKAETSSEEG